MVLIVKVMETLKVKVAVEVNLIREHKPWSVYDIDKYFVYF